MKTYNDFIYGSNATDGVVSIEPNGDTCTVFREVNGEVIEEKVPHKYWLISSEPIPQGGIPLAGGLHYQYYAATSDPKEFRKLHTSMQQNGTDVFRVFNPKEAHLIRSGMTYYKGLEPKDVSILSFDIETTGLTHNDESAVLLISNTLRRNGKVERKLFSFDQYKSQKQMIREWCKWVVAKDPSLLVGHNIFGFDLPYLRHCGGPLNLGRGGKAARFAQNTSQFRKDGSQSYDYNNVTVYGREVIDTLFLAIKYDIGRKYPSYGLKTIINFEGLEREGRQHYDASQIHKDYKNPIKFEIIKRYAKDDADDSLKLFDLMAAPFFYYAQSIPKTFQQIINSATGSQVNSFMVRSYIAERHSIPKASPTQGYEGGISFGNPGIYNDCHKVDVASLYPSIIRQWEISDKAKDPLGHFLTMVSTFTDQRLKHKRLAKETGDRAYKDREQAEKIMINSAYGFLGAPGLNFNSPKSAALVTKTGRQILEQGIEFAENLGYQIVNADTDSFMFTGLDTTFPEFIDSLNGEYPEMIRWEDDGVYECVIVVAAKNYVLKSVNGDLTIKGAALKASMKEPALREFINKTINLMLEGKNESIGTIYNEFVHRICCIDKSDITDWCSKKTVTKAVLKPNRTNEQRILDAIKSAGRHVQEGDKIKIFFKTDKELALAEAFDGVYCSSKLFEKLYKTVSIFDSILDITEFPNYKLKRNQKALERMLGKND